VSASATPETKIQQSLSTTSTSPPVCTIQTAVNFLAFAILACLSSYYSRALSISDLVKSAVVAAVGYDFTLFNIGHSRLITLIGRMIGICLANYINYWSVPFWQKPVVSIPLLKLSMAQVLICTFVTYMFPLTPIFSRASEHVKNLQEENKKLLKDLDSARELIRYYQNQESVSKDDKDDCR